MKKKLITILAAIILVAPLSGCTTYQEAVLAGENKEMFFGGYFTAIVEWSDSHGNYCVAYANDTKVKYLLMTSQYCSGISPLYNADGTLQIYK